MQIIQGREKGYKRNGARIDPRRHGIITKDQCYEFESSVDLGYSSSLQFIQKSEGQRFFHS